MESILNYEVILIGKALLITILGVFIGLILKYFLRRLIDKLLLKKLIKDSSTYETTYTINKVFTEVLQWIIIIWALDYSLVLLGFDFLTNALSYLIANISSIVIFILIIAAGIVISKLIVTRIKDQNIENKNEISTLSELVILTAFFLSALEFIGVKATALIELYKVILYIIGAVIVLLIINPKIFDNSKSPSKKKSKSLKFF